MKFNNLQELIKSFTKGKFDSLPEELTIKGVDYRLYNSSNYHFKDIINEHKKPMVVYSVKPQKENMQRFEELHTNSDDSNSFQERLVLAWADDDLEVDPLTVKFMTKARMGATVVESDDYITEVGDPNDPRDISTKIEIILSTFNANKPIDAKVDTGAEMSSIRVNNLKVSERGGVCSFNFYNKNITMGYDGFQSIRIGDETENRPVVTFNVIVPTKDPNQKDITVNNVKFNINDVPNQDIVKGDAYRDILLGMNFINAGKFRVVGAAKHESIDWDNLQEEFINVARSNKTKAQPTVEDVYELMEQVNFSLSDLISYINKKS